MSAQSVWRYRLQRFALWSTRALGAERRARWLSTCYEMYQVALGRGEGANWGTVGASGWGWRDRARGFRSVYRLHRQGHVLPGVWRYLEENPSPPRKRGGQRGQPLFPDWIVDDLKALGAIEPSLWPTDDFLSRYHRWQAPIDDAPGEVYADLFLALQARNYDVVLLAPWLREGGADKGTLQYVSFYAARFPRTLLITTRPEPSPWLNHAPAGVEVLEAGKALSRLLPDDQTAVVSRLLLELSPALVHLVQSDIGWRTVSRYGSAIRTNGTRCIASLFTHETLADKPRTGYAATYMPSARETLDAVFTDNHPFAQDLTREFALKPGIARPLYFWVDTPQGQGGDSSLSIDASPPRVLWASRFCWQKRPDILLAIARAMPDVLFDVYGASDGETVDLYAEIKRLANVRLFGRYRSFPEIVAAGPFVCFLYTTAFDGLPNVLLEAASAGLPIVCPAHIGGISDLVSAESGYPVADAARADDYIAGIRSVLADPRDAERRAQLAAAICLERHSKQAFMASMDNALVQIGLSVLPDVRRRENTAKGVPHPLSTEEIVPGTALLILGMHRSGTSALTGALEIAGVHLSQNLTPAASYNKKGLFEHDRVWRIHNVLLGAMGRTSADIRALPEAWFASPAAEYARTALIAALRPDMANQPLWGVKDPRLCRLFPLWPAILQSLGAEPKILLALRHPEEVVASLVARDHLDPTHAKVLWLRYTLEAERATRGLLRTTQVYDRLLTAWRQEFKRIAEALAIPLRRDAKAARLLDDFLDTGLRHHTTADDWSRSPDPWERMCHDTYTVLSQEKESAWPQVLNAIHDRLAAIEDSSSDTHRNFAMRRSDDRLEIRDRAIR